MKPGTSNRTVAGSGTLMCGSESDVPYWKYMKPLVKTTGSRGMHIYVPIVRGPTQKEVWTIAKALAIELAARHRRVMTSVYAVAKRPKDRVLIDYNQNAWGRTLASIYSVRPRPRAPVSTPVSWKEVERGVEVEDWRFDNVRARLAKVGDLWKPLLQRTGRVDFRRFL
jgi:bifunctional non-homologous end joining protein LigD